MGHTPSHITRPHDPSPNRILKIQNQPMSLPVAGPAMTVKASPSLVMVMVMAKGGDMFLHDINDASRRGHANEHAQEKQTILEPLHLEGTLNPLNFAGPLLDGHRR
jgi:hypothetical protein